MNKLEKIEQDAFENNIKVHKYYLGEDNLKGLYMDGNIALSDKLETTAEKACILAEELGHHYTTVGNIVELTPPGNRKQEQQARLWAYNNLIGLYGLIRAFEYGCSSRYDVAEYLEVTEDFLQEAVECYRSKYGIGTVIDNYYIMFIPNLQIMKLI